MKFPGEDFRDGFGGISHGNGLLFPGCGKPAGPSREPATDPR